MSDVDEFEAISAHALSLGRPAPRVERRTANDGGRLSALHWSGGKPLRVFLHGARLNAHTWDGLQLRLGGDAVVYDLPGHGHSGRRGPLGYGMLEMAAVISADLRSRVRGPFTLVGHSVGGVLAGLVAAHGENDIRRLVMLDASPRGIGSTTVEEVPRLRGTFDDLVDDLVVRMPGRSRASIARGVALNAHEAAGGVWEWLWDPDYVATSTSRGQELPAIWRAFESLDVPAHLWRGERPGAIAPEVAAEFIARVRHVELDIAPGSGHNVHNEAVDWVAAKLRAVDGTSS